MKAVDDVAERVGAVSTLRLVAFFTALDAVAVILYWLYTGEILHSRFFRLARDRGFAELCQYLKFAVILVLLVRWRRTRPAPLLGAWVLLFGVMLADDAIGIHEAMGGWILRWVPIRAPEGMRAKDLAEAAAFAAVEGSALLYVVIRYFGAPADLRRYSRQLILALAPLVICGLVLDNVYLPNLEQYGEMLAMTLLLGFVHRQHRLRAAAAPAVGAS
jgi:hypothetical protein